jgi:DNA-binding MarR family transcriptional regulator
VTTDAAPSEVAGALIVAIGLLRRRLHQVPVAGELSIPERAALSRLDRGGPATAAELARLEQISPQSVGVTVATLHERGLVKRHPDPDDGRRMVLSLTSSGRAMIADRRHARTEQVAAAISAEFSRTEINRLMAAMPLLERLADAI